jgi:hypothetical protein
VDNHTIAKYTKDGHFVAAWEGPDDGPVLHLDSAAVIDGKIYCSHSNYRYFPMTSSIEVWDAETIPLNIRGQGIAWDRSEPGVLYGIIRATDEEEDQGLTNRVVVFGSNLPNKHDDDKHREGRKH